MDDLASFGVNELDAAEWVDIEDEPEQFEVYKENWRALQVFLSMSTQWRWTGGMASMRAGLDYGVIHHSYEAFGVKRKEQPAMFFAIRSMERAALAAWSEMVKKP